MLSHSPKEAAQRRKLLCAGLPETQHSHHLPLMDIELSGLSVEALVQLPPQQREGNDD